MEMARVITEWSEIIENLSAVVKFVYPIMNISLRQICKNSLLVYNNSKDNSLFEGC